MRRRTAIRLRASAGFIGSFDPIARRAWAAGGLPRHVRATSDELAPTRA
ncbi:hypothetical protein [Sphingomonas sp. 1P08PE]